MYWNLIKVTCDKHIAKWGKIEIVSSNVKNEKRMSTLSTLI
jgi:hypothetical protein